MRAESTFARRAINNDSWYDPPEARGASESVSGEAVVLEVAPGKYLFALLKGLPSPFEVFFPGEAPVEVASRMKRLRGHRPAIRTTISGSAAAASGVSGAMRSMLPHWPSGAARDAPRSRGSPHPPPRVRGRHGGRRSGP